MYNNRTTNKYATEFIAWFKGKYLDPNNGEILLKDMISAMGGITDHALATMGLVFSKELNTELHPLELLAYSMLLQDYEFKDIKPEMITALLNDFYITLGGLSK